jgi:transcriptional regulator with XRE-family HTH domain
MKVRGAYGKDYSHRQANTFGERVRQIRLSWGWTQGQLAKAVHSKQNAVSKWENDTAQPTGAALGSLAALYRLSQEALITGDGFSITAPPIGDGEEQSRTPPLQVSLPVTDKVQALHVDYQSATVCPIKPGKASGLIRDAIAKGKRVWLVIK